MLIDNIVNCGIMKVCIDNFSEIVNNFAPKLLGNIVFIYTHTHTHTNTGVSEDRPF
jgi:hypothetical protein